MSFRVAARTILHLGAELISSDGVAFYELIKNGLDAGSQSVRIDVDIALPQPTYRRLMEEINHSVESDLNRKPDSAANASSLENIRAEACDGIDDSSPTASEAVELLRRAETWAQLKTGLDSVYSNLNRIQISDVGSGMSLQDLTDVYLTIGTPSRYLEREQWKKDVLSGNGSRENDRPVLGEKGVGRLSAMRLGNKISIETSRTGEHNWNLLEIDWSLFSEDPNAMLEDLPLEPRVGGPKENLTLSGTTITISGLSSNWSQDILRNVVSQEFSKLVDPFIVGVRFPFSVRFNGIQIEIPLFVRELFEQAHATVTAKYEIYPVPRFSGRIWYAGNRRSSNGGRETTFSLEGTHLVSTVGGKLSQDDITAVSLRNLGPFTLTIYWYNRQRLRGIDGIGNLNAVRSLLSRWAGGIMVYRDGFRVGHYGDMDDDWLGLDVRAFQLSSFKVNRAQTVGKIDITSMNNPQLVDLTNREGLRDTVEQRELVQLLKWFIETPFRGFLDSVDKEKPANEDLNFEDLQERALSRESELDQVVARLVLEHPEIDQQYKIKELIEQNREILRSTMAEVRRRASEYESGRSQLVHLAGVGLLVEILAHELNRATTHTLNTLADAKRESIGGEHDHVFLTLESQIRSLQKRLRTLDPLSTRGRQVKERFDLVGWVKEILEGHRAQFQRHRIQLHFRTEPKIDAILRINAVKGMIVQVLENLINNSVYWLGQEHRLNPTFSPEIEVVVDTNKQQVRFSDNGPGIEPDRKELVFQAFHSTKPPGAGSGLGLFIAREIAEYHQADLYLIAAPDFTQENLHTFVFDLQPTQQDATGEIN